MHPKAISSALGVVVAAGGIVMLIPLIFSLFAADGTTPAFAFPALGAIVIGASVFFLTRKSDTYVSAQDVFLIVVFGWISVAIVGGSPFLISGLMGPMDSYFEAMAGFTTTGATTVVIPEDVAPSLLLWRSISQWAGGIGIVVLFVAVGPLVGFGAAQMYSAEVANPVPERLTPRIQDTAKVLATVYLALTAGGIISLYLAGLSAFDAVNHALTTVSTGGYSTRSESIAAFDSWAVELAIMSGMLLSGINFALYFQLARRRTRLVFGSPELRVYLGLIAVGTAVTTAALFAFDYQNSPVLAFREALFQTVSLLTGTAFSTADWSAWHPISQGLLILFMAIGGCAGSTSGGIKVIRVILLLQHARQQIFQMLHPRAVTPLKLRENTISDRLRIAVLGFFFVYVATLVVGTAVMALHQIPLESAFGSVFACLNITGTFLGSTGSAEFYAGLPATAKATLTLVMLLGRLELFTVLVILTPSFWR